MKNFLEKHVKPVSYTHLDADNLIFTEEMNAIREKAKESSYEGLECILKALEKAKIRLNANVNFDMVMELLLLTMKEN